MAEKTWILTDVDAHRHIPELTVGPGDVGAAGDWSIKKHSLHGGLREGVEAVHVDNGRLRFTVLPTRGMGLWKAWLGDLEFGWQSPIKGPVHPALVPLTEPSGLGWLDGFDELLCRCGLQSNGPPVFDDHNVLKHPLHGRIANQPAHRLELGVDAATGDLRVSGSVDESRFLFQSLRLSSTVVTKIGSSSLQIIDEVVNLGGSPAELELLYHINFGRPLLDEGSQFIAPLKTLVPRDPRAAEGIGSWNRYAAEQAGFAEQVYFAELHAGAGGMTHVLLKNARGEQGVSLRFNKTQLPCFALWKNTAAAVDGYVTGLEPATNFPNPRGFEAEQRRILTIPPQGKLRFELILDFHGERSSVEQAEADVGRLQAGKPPVIHTTPQPGWTRS